MAEMKKTTAAPVAKEIEKVATPAKPVEAAKTTAVTAKVEVKAEEKTPVQTAKKAPEKKTVKQAEKSTATKSTAKKTSVSKKTETKAPAKAKKVQTKQIVNLQFASKSYTMDDLVKMAEDVWKFDLHKSDEVYTSLELYVKPEESIAYYVFNGDVTGNFFI